MLGGGKLTSKYIMLKRKLTVHEDIGTVERGDRG
jgi:hypothetical protein